jgi:hypothetical protein
MGNEQGRAEGDIGASAAHWIVHVCIMRGEFSLGCSLPWSERDPCPPCPGSKDAAPPSLETLTLSSDQPKNQTAITGLEAEQPLAATSSPLHHPRNHPAKRWSYRTRMMKRRCIGRGTVAKLLNMEHHSQRTSTVLLLSTPHRSERGEKHFLTLPRYEGIDPPTSGCKEGPRSSQEMQTPGHHGTTPKPRLWLRQWELPPEKAETHSPNSPKVTPSGRKRRWALLSPNPWGFGISPG